MGQLPFAFGKYELSIRSLCTCAILSADACMLPPPPSAQASLLNGGSGARAAPSGGSRRGLFGSAVSAKSLETAADGAGSKVRGDAAYVASCHGLLLPPCLHHTRSATVATAACSLLATSWPLAAPTSARLGQGLQMLRLLCQRARGQLPLLLQLLTRASRRHRP